MSEDTGRIHRHNYESQFTIMPHHIVEHETLSWVSKSILWYLLSRPLDWKVYRAQIAKVYKGSTRGSGEYAVDAAFDELIEHRFIIYTDKDKNTGRFIHRYDVYPEQQPKVDDIKEKIPKAVKPPMGSPIDGLNHPQPSTDSIPRKEKNNNAPEAQGASPVVVFSSLQEIGMDHCLKVKLSEGFSEEQVDSALTDYHAAKVKPDNAYGWIVKCIQRGGFKALPTQEERFEENKTWAKEELKKHDDQMVGDYRCDILNMSVDFTPVGGQPRFFLYENASFQGEVAEFLKKHFKQERK